MHRFIILDEMKEPFRSFSSKIDADHFLSTRPECSLKILPKPPKENTYDKMYETLGECLF
jgi:hypothetical protein